jgi:hypothetical protein
LGLPSSAWTTMPPLDDRATPSRSAHPVPPSLRSPPRGRGSTSSSCSNPRPHAPLPDAPSLSLCPYRRPSLSLHRRSLRSSGLVISLPPHPALSLDTASPSSILSRHFVSAISQPQGTISCNRRSPEPTPYHARPALDSRGLPHQNPPTPRFLPFVAELPPPPSPPPPATRRRRRRRAPRRREREAVTC